MQEPRHKKGLSLRIKPVKDKESFEITLSDHDLDRLETFLREINYPALNCIEVRVGVIGFSDGTVWTGRMMRRDADSPFGWSIIEPPESNESQVERPKGSALSGTANFLKSTFIHSTAGETFNSLGAVLAARRWRNPFVGRISHHPRLWRSCHWPKESSTA